MKAGLRHSRLIAWSATVLAATFFATLGAQAQSWDEVVAAAKKEGRLTLYHNLRPAGIEPLLQQFRAAFPGIQTEHIRLGSAPLNERFRTEFAAGRNVADVLITYPEAEFMKEVANRFVAWQPPELKGNFPDGTAIQECLFVIQQVRETIVWNKTLVKDADAPREWVELFDPKWKGKVAINQPWRSISVQQMLAYWETIGLKNAAERLRDNQVRMFEGSSGIIQAIIRGDVHVAAMTDIPLNEMLADGAPVGFAYPKSGTTTSNSLIGVSAKAPHPNAGRVFVNWLMSKEGQALLVEHGGLSVTRNGAPALSHLPTTSALPKTVDGMPLLPAEVQRPMIEHWRVVFGVK